MTCAEWRKQGGHLSLPLHSLEKSLTTWPDLGSVERRKSTASSTEVTWDMSRGYLRVKGTDQWIWIWHYSYEKSLVKEVAKLVYCASLLWRQQRFGTSKLLTTPKISNSINIEVTQAFSGCHLGDYNWKNSFGSPQWSWKLFREPHMTCTYRAQYWRINLVEKTGQWEWHRRNARTEILMLLLIWSLELVNDFEEASEIFEFLLLSKAALKFNNFWLKYRKYSWTTPLQPIFQPSHLQKCGTHLFCFPHLNELALLRLETVCLVKLDLRPPL